MEVIGFNANESINDGFCRLGSSGSGVKFLKLKKLSNDEVKTVAFDNSELFVTPAKDNDE